MNGTILTLALVGAALLGPDGLRVPLAEDAMGPALALVDGDGQLVGVVHGTEPMYGWTLLVVDARGQTRIVLGGWGQAMRERGIDPTKQPALFLDAAGEPVEVGDGRSWSVVRTYEDADGNWECELRDGAGVVRARKWFAGDSGETELVDRRGEAVVTLSHDEARQSLWVTLTRPHRRSQETSSVAQAGVVEDPYQVVLGPIYPIAVPCLTLEQHRAGYEAPADQLHCLPEASSPYRVPSRYFFEDREGNRRWIPALRWDHDLPETQSD